FFEDLAGDPLPARLGEETAEADLHATGRALREFHGGPRSAEGKDLAREIAVAALRHETARRLRAPGEAERSDALERLRVLSSGLPPFPSPRLHGDFYEKQVLVRPDGLAFVDLDDSSAGDPALDLGNFLAHLELRQALGTLGAERREVL